ncbi:MAG: hypothetical protein ACE5HK_06550 [Candidatus Methylomirabilales bacterium]
MTISPLSQGVELGSSAAVFQRLRITQVAMVGAVLVYGALVVLARSLGLVPPEGFLGHFPGLRVVVWLVVAGCFLAIQRVRERWSMSP